MTFDGASCSTSTCSSNATDAPRFIDEGYIELVSVIGTGAYGVVYLGIDARYQQPTYRAIKCLRRNGLDSRQRHFQRREIALHSLASAHSSIVTMDRLIEEGDYIYVVMDYGEDGDLFSMITDRQRFVGDDELIRDVFLQLLDGVDYLHQVGIAHRDVKPENVVCSEDGTRVALCDFGLATSEPTSSEFGCGSSFYIAPECLGGWIPNQQTYPTHPGDIWSLGVILVNLVSGRNPWRIASPQDESFNAFLNDPEFLRQILPISKQCLYILTQIFTVDPAHRISIPALRKLILQVDTFSMEEEELRAAHLAAQKTKARAQMVVNPPSEGSDLSDGSYAETAFTSNQETPSLRADSGSPSPPIRTSRSSSSTGDSLPPTPLMCPGDMDPQTIPHMSSQLWELIKAADEKTRERYCNELRINPSPDAITASGASPFFR